MSHTPWMRFNAVLLYAMVLSGVILAAGHVKTRMEWRPARPGTARVEIDGVHVLAEHLRRDQAVLALSFDMKLASLFDDWSTKLLFAWVQVEYSTKDHPRNVVTLLDHLVLDRDHANMTGKGVLAEYVLDDPGTNLKDTELTVNVRVDAFPNIGLMGKHHTLRDVTTFEQPAFTLPSQYIVPQDPRMRRRVGRP